MIRHDARVAAAFDGAHRVLLPELVDRVAGVRDSETELQKSEQRLRQRFKRVKDRLRELAKEEGLL